MADKKIGLKLYLEGVSVPIISASRVQRKGHFVRGAIVIPPTPYLFTRKVQQRLIRTMVQVFFYEDHEWKLFFEGEVLGIGMQRSPQSRGFILQCVAFSNYLDMGKVYFYDWSHPEVFAPVRNNPNVLDALKKIDLIITPGEKILTPKFENTVDTCIERSINPTNGELSIKMIEKCYEENLINLNTEEGQEFKKRVDKIKGAYEKLDDQEMDAEEIAETSHNIPPYVKEKTQKHDTVINKYGTKYGVDSDLVRGHMYQESGVMNCSSNTVGLDRTKYKTLPDGSKEYMVDDYNKAITEHKASGSNQALLDYAEKWDAGIGPMQVIPDTARRRGYSAKDMFNPDKNIDAGVQVIKWNQNECKNNIGKYNSGLNTENDVDECAIRMYHGGNNIKNWKTINDDYASKVTKYSGSSETTSKKDRGLGAFHEFPGKVCVIENQWLLEFDSMFLKLAKKEGILKAMKWIFEHYPDLHNNYPGLDSFFKIANYRYNFAKRLILDENYSVETYIMRFFGYKLYTGAMFESIGSSTTLKQLLDRMMAHIFYEYINLASPSPVKWKGQKPKGAFRINSDILKPIIPFAVPIKYNVIFPCNYSSFNYQRDFSREITKFTLGVTDMTTDMTELTRPFTVLRYSYPSAGTTLDQIFTGPIFGEKFITPHIFNPYRGKDSEKSDRMVQATKKMETDQQKREEYYKIIAQFYFYINKYASRGIGPITMPFNANLVIGYPSLILDTSGMHFCGTLESTYDVISIEGEGKATTTAEFSHPYHYKEERPHLISQAFEFLSLDYKDSLIGKAHYAPVFDDLEKDGKTFKDSSVMAAGKASMVDSIDYIFEEYIKSSDPTEFAERFTKRNIVNEDEYFREILELHKHTLKPIEIWQGMPIPSNVNAKDLGEKGWRQNIILGYVKDLIQNEYAFKG